MKIIYTLQTQLFVKNREGKETLLTTDTQNFVYDSLEEARKALEDLKQYHIAISDYKPLAGHTNRLFYKSMETGQLFTLEFEIKQFMLKESES